VYELAVQAGDIVLLASDGLFDNVWEHEITSAIDTYTRESEEENGGNLRLTSVDGLADSLVALASRNAASETKPSPFSETAKEWGYSYEGGKLDDITVVVGLVEG
jgi:protein phosphatase PTC7